MYIIYSVVDGALVYLPSGAVSELDGCVHPATVMLDYLGNDLEDFGTEEQGLGAEPRLVIPVEYEDRANEALQALGHTVTRDDSAIRW